MDRTAGSLGLWGAYEGTAGSLSLDGATNNAQLSFVHIRAARNLDMTFVIIFTGAVQIFWGDGSSQTAISGGTSNHNYAAGGQYQVILTGDVENITSLVCNPRNVISVSLPSTNSLININVTGNQLTTESASALVESVNDSDNINGDLVVSGQIPSAPLDAAGLIAKTELEGKGWTVSADT